MMRPIGILLVSVTVLGALPRQASADAGDPSLLDPLAQHQRLEARVAAAEQLTDPQRTQMSLNLEACRALGLAPAAVEGLFPGNPGGDLAPAAALRLQSELIRTAREGLPVEPLLDKLREGRLKRVPDAALVRAGEQLTAAVFQAAALLDDAARTGCTPPGDPQARGHQVRTLAQAVWRGLTPADVDRLLERVRARHAGPPVATADLVAAAEMTVQLREMGGEPEASLRLAGTALARGYAADDMLALGRLMAEGRLGHGDLDAVLSDLTGRVDGGLDAGGVQRYFLDSGWMGPADAPGAGGRQAGDHQGNRPGGGREGGRSGGSAP